MKTEHSSGGKGPPSVLTLISSVVTHLLILLPVLYIVGLAFQELEFFSAHPICMALGAGLLVTEAVFSISGEAFLSWKIKRLKRVTLHWILHTVGLSLLLIGFIIIIVNKNEHGRPHFYTNHAKLGLSTLILTAIVASFGIIANNTRWFYPRIKPVLIKVCHAFGGICITILLLAAVITGTYSFWWPGTDVGRNLVFASFFFGGALVLFKPIIAAVYRTRVLCSPPPSHNQAET